MSISPFLNGESYADLCLKAPSYASVSNEDSVALSGVIDGLVKDLTGYNLDSINQFPLVDARMSLSAQEYQSGLVIQEIFERLRGALRSDNSLSQFFIEAFDKCRNHLSWKSGYAPGNLLHILAKKDSAIAHTSFQDLAFRDTPLDGICFHECDFSRASFSHCSFTHSIGTVFSVAVSPLGDIMAFTDTKDVIHIWSSDGSLCRAVCRGHSNRVYSVAFSSDGKMMVSGSEDGTARIWDSYSGRCLHVLSGHAQRVWSASFYASDQKVVTTSEDGFIRSWDRVSGDCLSQWKGGHEGLRLGRCALHEEKNTIYYAMSDGVVNELLLSSGEVRRVYQAERPIRNVAISPTRPVIAIASGDAILVIDIDNGSLSHRFVDATPVEEGEGGVHALAFSNDGNLIASGDSRNVVRVWSLEHPETLQRFKGHRGIVWGVAFSSDNRTVISGSGDYSVRWWDMESQVCTRQVKGHTDFVWAAAFSPDDSCLAIGGDSGKILLREKQRESAPHFLHEHTEFVWSLCFSPDSKLLASASDDLTVKVWDVATRQCLRTLKGHSRWVQSVVFSPDGGTLVSGSDDATVRVWEVVSGNCRRVLRGHTQYVRSVAISPDGAMIISGSDDGTARLWQVSGSEEGELLFQASQRVWCVAFSPDGEKVGIASDDGNIHIVSLTSRKIEGTCRAPYFVAYFVFSPNGTSLFSCGGDNEVREFSLSDYQLVSTLRGHSSRVWSLACNASGTVVASCSEDESTRLWSTATKECIELVHGKRQYEGSKFIDATGIDPNTRASLFTFGAKISK
jgi:WD40 repeat protein